MQSAERQTWATMRKGGQQMGNWPALCDVRVCFCTVHRYALCVYDCGGWQLWPAFAANPKTGRCPAGCRQLTKRSFTTHNTTHIQAHVIFIMFAFCGRASRIALTFEFRIHSFIYSPVPADGHQPVHNSQRYMSIIIIVIIFVAVHKELVATDSWCPVYQCAATVAVAYNL